MDTFRITCFFKSTSSLPRRRRQCRLRRRRSRRRRWRHRRRCLIDWPKFLQAGGLWLGLPKLSVCDLPCRLDTPT